MSLFLAFLTLAAASRPKAMPMAGIHTFVIYEPVLTAQDASILQRLKPDLVCRAWFKWGTSLNWAALAPLAHGCKEYGVLLQGGITVAAIYPGENGMDEDTFRDFATTDVEGRLVQIGGPRGWYHLSLYNPKVIRYLEEDVRRQIDAGAAGIWYDEIEGYYDWIPTEGYDRYACTAFRDWLIAKYCRGKGWSENDGRWRTHFGIDLARYGGSIRNFDYRDYLLSTPGLGGKPLAVDPPQGDPRRWETSPNPLYREWGYAWDRRAKGTFRFDTVSRIFQELLQDANRYAWTKYRRRLINTYNHNGTARPGVSFLQPHNPSQPPILDGRLDARVSALPWYEAVVHDAAEVDPSVPVVFFVDWPGETDRLAALPREDQLLFFALYIPEAYAAGGEFALPIRGYTYSARDQGTLGYLARMLAFYRSLAPWLRGSHAVAGPVHAPEGVAARARRCPRGVAVHLVNHRFTLATHSLQKLKDVVVTLPWAGPAPGEIVEVSPDTPKALPVRCRSGKATITLIVPELEKSAMVLLPNKDVKVSPPFRSARAIPAGVPEAAGVLYDQFGIPMRNAVLHVGGRTYRADSWGRYRVPAGAVAARLEFPGEPELPLPLLPGFACWRLEAGEEAVGSFANGLGGFVANWSGKGEAADAVRIRTERHLGSASLRCDFLPVRALWRNVYSPRVAARGMDEIEIVYCGDGSNGAVQATIQALGRPEGDHFYSAPLPLRPRTWTTIRLPFTEFRDGEGHPYKPQGSGWISFQISAGGDWRGTGTVWLKSVRLIRQGGSRLRLAWRQDAFDFDTVDVDRQ
ncbi:MAG: hypothetical protein ACP5VE_13540 [Chthonomonadales bacterium]